MHISSKIGKVLKTGKLTYQERAPHEVLSSLHLLETVFYLWHFNFFLFEYEVLICETLYLRMIGWYHCVDL